MNNQTNPDLDHAYALFLTNLEPLETATPLPEPVAEFVALAREGAFRAGWDAHRSAATSNPSVAAFNIAQPADMSPVRVPRRPTVRAIVDLGDQAWVDPLAIIEDTETHDYFVDPRFPIAEAPSAKYCVELMVTEDGLVATGPADRHRLGTGVAHDRLRSLAEFEAVAVD